MFNMIDQQGPTVIHSTLDRRLDKKHCSKNTLKNKTERQKQVSEGSNTTTVLFIFLPFQFHYKLQIVPLSSLQQMSTLAVSNKVKIFYEIQTTTTV